VSGHVAVHQFCRIGAYAMLGGVSGIPKDIPPYVTASGQRARIIGLNLVGLRRNGFDQAQRSRIKAVYKLLFRSGLRLSDGLALAATEYPGTETQTIIDFISRSRRGIASFVRD
jgi:UDP-N-acetylglucosamine acyltransferase